MGPMMVAAGWKLLGQTMFVAAGITCFALHEREAGMLLIGMAGGSLVPVAEKHPKVALAVESAAEHAREVKAREESAKKLPRATIDKE